MTNDESRRCKSCGEVAAPKESGYASKESYELARHHAGAVATSKPVEAAREVPAKVAREEPKVVEKPVAATTTATPVTQEKTTAPVVAPTATPAPVAASTTKPAANTAPKKKGGFFAMCCGDKGHETS
jgi:hypothetical protein